MNLSAYRVLLFVSFLMIPAGVWGAATQFGVCINATDDNQSPTADELKSLGARWVRTIVYVGQYPRFQTVAARYQGQASVLALLNHETYGVDPPDANAPDATWNSYISGFAAAMRSFASQYDSYIGAYEIWNEPDLPGGISAYRFAQIIAATHLRIREVSTKPIITGGLAGPDWVTYLYTTMSYLAEHRYDGVGIHPYGQRSDGFPAGYGFGEIEDVVNIVYAFGRNKPVWLTEFGIALQEVGNDQNQQAEYLRRAYALFDQIGTSKVAAAFWFAWDDRVHYDPSTKRFGLVDEDHNRRQAWYKFRRVLCSTYTSSTSCNAAHATTACDWPTCNRGCFPVDTSPNDACGGLCGAFQTVGQCDLAANRNACAWYLCARLCLPRGTPVQTTCDCSNYDGAPTCNQHSAQCAYYLCREKCLARGTDVPQVCNFF